MSLERELVIAEARTWLRTPYHHEGAVKGAGVDCAMLPICVYRNALDLFTEFDPRPYPPEWHLHRNEEKYIEGLKRCGARQVAVPKPGDIAMFKFGRTVSHGSIVLDECANFEFIHSYLNMGVIMTRLNELDYADRLHSFWSVLA